MINVSEMAATKINELLTEENKAGSGLRVFVQGGGCSGFQYGLMIEENGQGAGDQVYESQRRQALRRPHQRPLPAGRRGRLRRHDHRRRLHDQEPERDVHLRLRLLVHGRLIGLERSLPDIAPACARPAASAPASATASSASSCARKGHLSADDLCDLVRREDAGIGRATVYRTLQWMVGAGIARKVDFGEGRSRFEPSYRHPRHFHLVCSTCHRSSEFLSSDVESLRRRDRRRAQLRGGPDHRPGGRHLRGVPDGPQDAPDRRRDDRARLRPRRPAHRDRHRAQRARVLYARGGPDERCAGPRGVPAPRRRGAGAPRHARGAVPRAPRRRIRSSRRARRSCSSRARRPGCSPRVPRSCGAAWTICQALIIGIKCERGSHKFFKRYGERFEDSEGKQIFLEFAEEEKTHLELLIREYRALRERRQAHRGRKRAVRSS